MKVKAERLQRCDGARLQLHSKNEKKKEEGEEKLCYWQLLQSTVRGIVACNIQVLFSYPSKKRGRGNADKKSSFAVVRVLFFFFIFIIDYHDIAKTVSMRGELPTPDERSATFLEKRDTKKTPWLYFAFTTLKKGRAKIGIFSGLGVKKHQWYSSITIPHHMQKRVLVGLACGPECTAWKNSTTRVCLGLRQKMFWWTGRRCMKEWLLSPVSFVLQ